MKYGVIPSKQRAGRNADDSSGTSCSERTRSLWSCSAVEMLFLKENNGNVQADEIRRQSRSRLTTPC